MSPFIVLHVCMGNICRSPMAERLLARAITARSGAADLVLSESAGTGGWHAGERMNPPAERELRRRGGDPDGFRARKLQASHIEAADLILTATAEQYEFALGLRPDAAARTFVLGEFGRLVAGLVPAGLPDGVPVTGPVPVDALAARAAAIVAAADALRSGAGPEPADDLDDPWGRDDAAFRATGDRIEAALRPFADLLLPGRA